MEFRGGGGAVEGRGGGSSGFGGGGAVGVPSTSGGGGYGGEYIGSGHGGGGHVHDKVLPPRRKYEPTLADLVDRLSITLQKMIFIPDQRAQYEAEAELLMHDIDLILTCPVAENIGAREVRAILVIMLANRYIWENEAAARAATDNNLPVEVRYRRLKATHSINGVRNAAKNVLSGLDQGRKDYKIDCFAAELVEELGNWNVLGDDLTSGTGGAE